MKLISLGAAGSGATATVGPLVMVRDARAPFGTNTINETLFILTSGTAYAAIAIQGSHDGATWFNCQDAARQDISADGLEGLVHFVLAAQYPHLRVAASSGDVDSAISAWITQP